MRSIDLRLAVLSRFLGALLLLALLPQSVQAQEIPVPEQVNTVEDRPAAPDSAFPSARSALIRSLVLPGWGQAYVGASGRGAFYFALEAGSLWMVYRANQALSAARQLEYELRENGALGSQQRHPLAASRAQQVEDWITLSIFWALFAGADAYVSAQLADFPGHVGVTPGVNGEMRFQVQLNTGPQ